MRTTDAERELLHTMRREGTARLEPEASPTDIQALAQRVHAGQTRTIQTTDAAYGPQREEQPSEGADEAEAPAGKSTTVFDPAELRQPTGRALLAAWQKLGGQRVWITQTGATRLAPLAAAPTSGPHGKSAAEDELARLAGRLTKHRRSMLIREAWWARRWRDPDGPFGIIELDTAQHELCERILDRIDARGFPLSDRDEYSGTSKARLVGEAMAIGARMLTASNPRLVDLREINRWKALDGTALGLDATPVVFDVDATLTRESRDAAGNLRLLQAALLAAWPDDDDAPAGEVMERAREHFEAMTAGNTRKLERTAGRILSGLAGHEDPNGLVESTRLLLASQPDRWGGTVRTG